MSTQTETPRSKLKDFTSELPVINLQEITEFVIKIHDKGVETQTMPEVAKEFGYASATSSPFYRRTLAAKLFGMLSQSGAELTKRAKDYMRPDSEGIKRQSLIDAVMAIPFYTEYIGKNVGKKLNPEFVRNGIATRFNLTPACAMLCANAFLASLKFAQMLSPDGVVGGSSVPIESADQKPTLEVLPPPQIIPPIGSSMQEQASQGTHTHILPLDKEKRRKITVNAPLDLTQKEIERITKWLSITLLIESDSSVGDT